MVQISCSFLNSAIFKSPTVTSATPISLCSHYIGVTEVTYSLNMDRDITWLLNIFYLEEHHIVHQQNRPELWEKFMK